MTNYLAPGRLRRCRSSRLRPPVPAIATRRASPRRLAPASLTFTFVQAGAETEGSFRQFSTELPTTRKSRGRLARGHGAGRVARNAGQGSRRGARGRRSARRGEFPHGEIPASSLAKRGRRLEAVGKLTLHGVTRELRMPLTSARRPTASRLSGETTITPARLRRRPGRMEVDRVGGYDVKLQYKAPLTRAR